ncbi:MAG: hypothetical protein KA715_14460 [Xanthomonadaceae bacterium]|nr:hypothetical protein [Xanthomonadaceae bacterium]
MMTRIAVAALFFTFTSLTSAHAGVFNIPKYIPSGQLGVGVEPELLMTNGAGIGINARFQYGLGEMTNAHLILGNGVGPRLFRVGGVMTFDFFPDVEGQPGIGMAVTALYSRVSTGARVDTLITPYLQKTISGRDSDFTPFMAIPIGIVFADNAAYAAVSQFVFGSGFKLSERFRYTIELGLGITASETYMSTGVMIYP